MMVGRVVRRGSWVWLAVVLPGCASITTGTGQDVLIDTVADARPVSGASCEVSNDKGAWTVITPGKLQVKGSAKPLIIQCTHAQFERGYGSFESKAKSMAFGNILIGGAIGAAIDISSGAAFEYPGMLSVVLGSSIGGTQGPGSTAAEQAAKSAALLPPGTVLKWTVTDAMTRVSRDVELRLDSTSNGVSSFNGGQREEFQDKSEFQYKTPELGDFDVFQPPGGWVRPGVSTGQSWRVNYDAKDGPPRSRVELTASVVRAERLNQAGRTLNTLLVEYTGVSFRAAGAVPLAHPTRFRVWWDPSLGRVVKFESRIRGAGGSQPGLPSQEVAELTAIDARP